MDALFYSLLSLNIIFCLVLLCIDIKRYSPAAVFWLSTLCFFLLPDFADPYLGVVNAHPFAVSFDLDIRTLVEAQLFIFYGMFCFLAAYILAWRMSPKFIQGGRAVFLREKESNNSKGLYWLLGFLGLSVYAFLEAYLQLGSDVFSQLDFAYRRERLSFLAQFLLSYNLNIAAGVLFWSYYKSRHLVFLLLIVIYACGYFVMGGSRQPLIILILPFFFFSLFQVKRPLLFIGCFALLSIALERVLRFLVYLRNLPGFYSRLEALTTWPNQIFASGDGMSQTESGLRFAFYYYVKNSDHISGFGQFSYFKRLVLFWLPSSIDVFSIKPPDFEYLMFMNYMPGYEGTMHPSFFGSIYADAGWFCIPWIVFFMGLLFFSVQSLKFYKGPCYFAIWGTWAYAFMMMARGALYGPFAVLIFGLFIVLFFQKIASVAVANKYSPFTL